MTNPAHRPSARTDLLDAAEAHLIKTGSISLDSAAKAAGLTKAGVLYHFKTKQALVEGILDRIIGDYVTDMEILIRQLEPDTNPQEASALTRVTAYVNWVCTAPIDSRDLVMFSDPKLRDVLTDRWSEHLEAFLAIPAEHPQRTDLLVLRFTGDGIWFNRAIGNVAPSPEELITIHQHLLTDLERISHE